MLFSGVPVILAHLKLKKRMMKNKKLWIYTFLLVMLGCYDDPVEDLRNDASAEGTLTIEAAHELYREYMSRRPVSRSLDDGGVRSRLDPGMITAHWESATVSNNGVNSYVAVPFHATRAYYAKSVRNEKYVSVLQKVVVVQEDSTLRNDVYVMSLIPEGEFAKKPKYELAVLSEGCGEESGECYGFNLLYSGSFAITADVSQNKSIRVQGGINDFLFGWQLQGGETFATPQAALCYSAEGLGGMSRAYHDFFREYIIDPKRVYARRPVVINNWEATYFDFDNEKLFSIIDEAAKLGVDTFVLDDGWFGKRDGDTSGLGDWFVNENKLKGGLAPLVKKINDLGLQFGIWFEPEMMFEPEMVSEDSDLYRAHPDWAIGKAGVEPCRGRNQLVLDFTRKEVVDYIFETVSKILRENDISYVKWDKNRDITENYTANLPADRQGEFWHRYTLGFYDLAKRLTEAFPNVFFEGCAGGGGRFDLGNMCYFPQFWTSDDTDARERTEIQAGSSYGYPQTVMGAHVSACPNHQTGNNTPLSARFNVACGGLLGYELDVTMFSDEERRAVSEQISFYKENRKLLQFGEHYRLEAENVCGFITVGKDRGEAVAVVNVMAYRPAMPVPVVRFKGLNASALYEVGLRGTDFRFVLSGDLLMNGNIPLDSVLRLMPRESGSIVSGMFVFRKVRS